MGSFARQAALAGCVAATALAAAGGAVAEQRVFNIPSEPAAEAIAEFARQADLQVIAPADQLKGVRTPSIFGPQDPRAALKLLLAGTGLSVAADDGELITLHWNGRASAPPQAASIPDGRVTVLTAPSPPTMSRTRIGEVVVTATKTGATNLQTTPLSVDVIPDIELFRDNIKNIKDLQQSTPSLKVTTNNPNVQVYIRGVGGFNGGESDVSIYLDGVFLSRMPVILQSDFNDLDRVEIIEGPQGTLFGRNSTGGAISFISKAPANTFRFSDTLSVGNYSLIDEAAAVSGPIADNVQASLSISHVQHDGYLHNVDPGVGNPGAANRTAVRGQVRWQPSADVNNTLRADYFYTHERWATNDTFLSPTVGFTWSDPLLTSINGKLAEVDVNSIPFETELSYGLSDELSWTPNEHFTLKSLAAGRTDDSYLAQDSLTDVNYSYGSSQYFEYQLSEELNLINNYGPFSGVFGLYYFNEHVRFLGYSYNPGGNAKVPDPAGGNLSSQNTLQPTIAKAAFFEETYHLAPTLGLTVGARYTQEHKTLNTDNSTVVYAPGYANNGAFTAPALGAVNPFVADLSKDADAFTPKVAVSWQATPNAMLYASATNSYKSGGYNGTARAAAGADFGQEKIWAYEVGAKTDWFDRRLRVNVAAFHYDWTGLQFNASIAPQVSAVSNASAAALDGLEASVAAKPLVGLTFTASATALRSDYVDFPQYAFQAGFKPFLLGDPRYNAAAGTYNASGNQLVNAPNLSINLSAQKDFDFPDGANLFLRAEYVFTSKTYFDPTNVAIASRPAFDLVNASIGYSPPHSHWQMALWGRNLTDTLYINGVGGGAFVTAPVGDPRTFGVRLNYVY